MSAKLIEYELDGGAIESPIFCNHKRGNNWMAVCTGKNAANVSRSFLPHRGEIFDLSAVKAGDVVEVAGDYTTSSGRRDPNRRFWHVAVIDDDQLSVWSHKTLAEAMRAARKGLPPITDETTAAVVTDHEEAIV